MSAVLAEISLREAALQGAEDSIFYSQFFFEREFRQDPAVFHETLWGLLEGNRLASAEIFRGGAKTTIARLFCSKRIAYGFARTILFISKSEDHAAESVKWLMTQVEYNTKWAQAFGLTKGSKWTGTDIEILHGVSGHTIRVKAYGILGSIRGVNVDGYRPDTIIVDDPCDEENTATEDGRIKMAELFFGAVKETLAPRSESPNGCLVLLQTPLVEGDLCSQCAKSPDFVSIRVGILTNDSDENSAESAWPARWSKEEILKDKRAAEARNQLSLWTREKMCLIIGRESSDFKEEWLQYWDIIPPDAIHVGAIDPAPVLSEVARLKGGKGAMQAIAVCAYWRKRKYVVEYKAARDQDPDMVIREIQRLNRKYHIRAWGVETVNYQATLKWYIEKHMKEGTLTSMRVIECKAVKDKTTRIRQAHTERASEGRLFTHRNHVEYNEQYKKHPNGALKDIIDAVSMCDYVVSPTMEQGQGAQLDESSYEDQGQWRGAP
jgi:predicted phage terminase large subunit-like protein